MTGGSLGLRSGSYGSLQQHLQIGVSPIQTNPLSAVVRKPSKMVKEKEKLLHWIFKFAGRKKVGMLFLCAVSAAVFIWVLYIAKGEDAQGVQIQNTGDNNSSYLGFLKSSPVYRDQINNNDITSFVLNHARVGEKVIKPSPSRPPPPPPPPPSSHPLPPPPPSPSPPNLMPPPPALPCSPTPPLPLPPPVFLGYALPHGNPCENFTLPPPPADKKRTGPRPCPVCYLPVEDAVALMPKAPSPSPIVTNLNYIYGENLSRSEFGGSDFGGYPSLQQRNDSYDIKESMNVHCGFFKGAKPGHETGFDIGDSDLHEMERCGGVVVASAIFGNYDVIQQPKNISEVSKMNVCFYMFVDEETEAYVKNSSVLDQSQKIGLWRIVVVHNLPYIDARRNGKVPKLLLHRIFPNARYSLWIDGKLELVVDPYQILERFLWRKNATFAISRHYKRFDVFVEAEANKAAGKYDNASIDFQVDFYRREGLTAYSDAKLPITSDVPEGCVIIREHIPITNLFTCLWFNEVDRFTSRDQISFSTVRDKISSKVNWSINMFLDCERRNFVVQGYHKDLLDHMAPPHARNHVPLSPPPPLPPILSPPPPTLRPSDEMGLSPPVRKIPQKRGRDRRRHRKVAAGSRDSSSSKNKFV